MRRDKPNPSIALAADMNVDLFPTLTARILTVYLRLEANFIDMYELSFRMSLIFSKYVSTWSGYYSL